MNQSLNYYYIFSKVAEYGNISHASEVLFISQPAVSKSISKLEESLGVALFKRIPKGVVLTEDGMELYKELKVAFSAIEQGEKALIQNKALGIGKLRLGTSATLCRYVALPYLSKLIEQRPNIRIQIACHSSIQCLKRLEHDAIDVALIAKPKELSSGIDFTTICELKDIFVCTKSYLDNLKATFCIKGNDLNQIIPHGSLMLLDEENSTRLYVNKYLESNSIESKKILEVTSMDLLIEFAKIGMGIACVVENFVKSELASGELIELPMKKKMNARVAGFAYKKSSLQERSVEEFIKIISEIDSFGD